MSDSRKTLRKAFYQMRTLLSRAAKSPERLSSLLVAQMCSAKSRHHWSEEERRSYKLARQQGLSMQEATHAALIASQLESVPLCELLGRLSLGPELGRTLYRRYSPLRKRHKPAD